MSDQFLVGFPACLKAEPVQIFRFVIEVATDAARLDTGRSLKARKKRAASLHAFRGQPGRRSAQESWASLGAAYRYR